MNCPLCGYMIDAFDTECPKCHGKGLKSESPCAIVDATPDVTPVASAITIHRPSSPPNSSPASSTPPDVVTDGVPDPAPIQHLVLSCPVCGSENVQKVSAIRQAGTQHSSSNDTSQGFSVGLGHGFGGGNLGMVGLNTAKHRSSETTHTALASRLSPPSPSRMPDEPRPPGSPAPYTKGGEIGCWLLCLAPLDFITFFVCFLWGYRPP